MDSPLSEAADAARIAINQKGFGGAKPVIASLCEQHKEDQTLHAFYGLAVLWTGMQEEADAYLKQRARLTPSASVYGVQGELAQFRANKDLAHSLLAEAEKIDPDDYLFLRAAHSLAMTEKDESRAEALRKRWLELYPTDPDVYAGGITVLQVQGRIDALQDFIENCPEWFKKTAQFHAARGRVAFSRHDMPKMEEEFQQAVAMMPESSMYWAYLAEAQVYQGKLQEAERSAQFAIDINPKTPMALRVLAKTSKAAGNLKAAEDYQRRATEAIPALKSSGKASEAADLLRRGDTEGALKLYRQQAADANPILAATARRIILSVLIEKGRWAEARHHLDVMEGLGDDHRSIESSRWRILFQEGHREAAVEGLRGMSFQPQTAEFYPDALAVFLQADAADDVQRLVEILRSTEVGNASALGKCVMLLSNAGRKEHARALYDVAVRRFPNVHVLKVLGAGLQAEDGNLAGAIRLLKSVPPNERPKLKKPEPSLKDKARRFFGGKPKT